jgi:hypothetical protein
VKKEVKTKLDVEDNPTPTPSKEATPAPIKFNISIMDQFTHQQLQQVILKYDSELKKMKAILTEKN